VETAFLGMLIELQREVERLRVAGISSGAGESA